MPFVTETYSDAEDKWIVADGHKTEASGSYASASSFYDSDDGVTQDHSSGHSGFSSTYTWAYTMASDRTWELDSGTHVHSASGNTASSTSASESTSSSGFSSGHTEVWRWGSSYGLTFTETYSKAEDKWIVDNGYMTEASGGSGNASEFYNYDDGETETHSSGQSESSYSYSCAYTMASDGDWEVASGSGWSSYSGCSGSGHTQSVETATSTDISSEHNAYTSVDSEHHTWQGSSDYEKQENGSWLTTHSRETTTDDTDWSTDASHTFASADGSSWASEDWAYSAEGQSHYSSTRIGTRNASGEWSSSTSTTSNQSASGSISDEWFKHDEWLGEYDVPSGSEEHYTAHDECDYSQANDEDGSNDVSGNYGDTLDEWHGSTHSSSESASFYIEHMTFPGWGPQFSRSFHDIFSFDPPEGSNFQYRLSSLPFTSSPASNSSLATTESTSPSGDLPVRDEPLGGLPVSNEPYVIRDSQGHRTALVDVQGGVTRFTYDQAGNLASLTDPVGNSTSWLYDQGRLTQETDAVGAARYFTYDSAGNLSRYRDRNGQVRQYQYVDGNVASESWYANGDDADAQENATNTITYQRDSAGRITSESDSLSSVVYVYNDAGQITSTTQSSVGGPTVMLTYQYDTAGRRTQMAATIDGTADFVDDYVCDGLGRVISVIEHGVEDGNAVALKEIDLAYNTFGQIVSIDRYENGQLVVEGDYSYDGNGRLIGLLYHLGETILNSYAWTYSGDSSVASASPLAPWSPTGGLMPVHDTSGVVAALVSGGLAGVDLLTSCTSIDGTANYSYDPTGQLVGATYTGGLPDESYAWDANGNRTNAGYVVGAGNRLLSDGTYWYAYDAEGNRTARFIDVDQDAIPDAGDIDITQYAWDNRNRLVKVTNHATAGGAVTQIVDYLYDVENRWIGEAIDSNGDGTVDRQIRFAYDGNQIVLQFDKEGTGTLAAGDLSHRFLWQPDVVDQLMADERTHLATGGNAATDDVLWALTDQLGSVRDLARSDGATTSIVDHVIYDSFGKVASESNSAEGSLFKFTGRPTDNATGIENHWQRVKPARSVGWMNPDPSGLGADVNPYRYCGNSPTNLTDPTGLDGEFGDEHNLWITHHRDQFEQLRQASLAKVDNALQKLDAKHAQYAYYVPAGVKDYLSSLRGLLSGFVGMVCENAWTSLEAKWGTMSRHLFLSQTIAKTDVIVILHELTHALDHKNGWNLGVGTSWKALVWSAANLRSAEQLAYSAEHLFRYCDMFQQFEDRLKRGYYQDEASLNEGWETAWRSLAVFVNTTVYVDGNPEGRVTNAMFDDLARKTGLRFSYAKLEPYYQELVNTYMNCPYSLRKPASLPAALQ